MSTLFLGKRRGGAASSLWARALVAAVCAFGVIAGCAGTPTDGGLPTPKPLTEEEAKDYQKKLQEAKGSGYKGAPGVPYRPGKQ
jgi:hypothetical protein